MAKKLLENLEEYRRLNAAQWEFKEKIPVGSVVWENSSKELYGTTGPGGYYDDLTNPYVFLENINGDGPDHGGMWSAERLLLKTEHTPE